MSIYRRKHRDKAGKVKLSKLYTAEFAYRGQIHRKNGLPDREAAKHWIQTEQLRLRRGAVGFVKAMHAAQVAPLIEQYADHLRSRGRDEMYVYTMEKRLNRLAGDCGWITLQHVSRDSLVGWMKREQTIAAGANRGGKMSAKTKNQYMDSAVEWGKWLASVDVAKLPASPFAGMQHLPARSNDNYRRAATVDELNKLLGKCDADRRLYYLFRIYTPIRSGALAAMTWRMMHLDANPPYVALPAAINKSRKDEKHAIRFDTAVELRARRKSTKARADDRVFPNPPTLEVFRADLQAAGVSQQIARNVGRLDYHALRTSVVSLAKDAGLTAFQAMDLLGHKDVRTTLKHYHRASIEADKGAAVEKLPALGKVRKAQ